MLYPALLRQILFCVAVIWSAEASAQAYPLRPITLVAPYAAGSGIDVMARKISAYLSPRLGQPISATTIGLCGNTCCRRLNCASE